jgi:hypothetical protein
VNALPSACNGGGGGVDGISKNVLSIMEDRLGKSLKMQKDILEHVPIMVGFYMLGDTLCVLERYAGIPICESICEVKGSNQDDNKKVKEKEDEVEEDEKKNLRK